MIPFKVGLIRVVKAENQAFVEIIGQSRLIEYILIHIWIEKLPAIACYEIISSAWVQVYFPGIPPAKTTIVRINFD